VELSVRVSFRVFTTVTVNTSYFLVCQIFNSGSQVFLYHEKKGGTFRPSTKLRVILYHTTSNLYCVTAYDDEV